MHVERWWLDVCLANHHMHLAAVMRLVVEEVKHGGGGCVHAILAQAIGIAKLPLQKVNIHLDEKGLDLLVLCCSRGAQLGETVEQNRVQWRCRATASAKPRH